MYEGRPFQRLRSASPLLLAKAENIPSSAKIVNKSNDKWILVVEDEDDLRSAIGKFLAKEGGYHVTGVSDARSAILVCRGGVRPSSSRSRFKFDPSFTTNSTNNSTQFTGPDCLVLDIRLLAGSMDGLELLKIIRSDPLLESLPVVLLTAKGKVEDGTRGYEAGADAYLPKPFDPEELLSIVNGIIRGDAQGATVQNENNAVNGDLKNELMEIKALMQGLDSRPFTPPSHDPMSVNSLRSDILDMKETIKDNANLLPQSTNFVRDQFSTMSVLTPEETKIIHFVAQGMTNKDIATEMRCSISKVEKHISAMFKKSKVKKRSGLIVWSNKNASISQIDVREKPSLTSEEKILLDFLDKGLTTEEIISKTQSTAKIIGKHLENLLEVAKVQNRTELVRWWRAKVKEHAGMEENYA